MEIILKILRLPHNKIVPEYKTDGSSGLDLAAAVKEPVVLQPFQRMLIPTGLIIELPNGYEAQVRARSGLAIKHGITLINGIGTVDSDYRGEICVPLVNLSDRDYEINPGERIAQMIIMKIENVKILVTTELSDTERGCGGFGSTGKN